MIGIIDYGMGNLASVHHALQFLGADSETVADPATLAHYNALILPGVGAFGEAVERLSENDLSQAIRRQVGEGKALLGICLGLQLLFDASEEGTGEGLGLIPGLVKKMPESPGVLIPHIGWNRIERSLSPLLREGDFMYFVHSYHVVPADPAVATAWTIHGEPFVSAVASANVTAFQFHPEKSGTQGLAALNRWLNQLR